MAPKRHLRVQERPERRPTGPKKYPTEQEALELAISTWPKDIKPIVHYSESKMLHEGNDKIKPQAHSDYITKIPSTYGHDVDIMVEAKAKELAILPFIKPDRCEYSGLLSTSSYAS